MVNKSMDSFLRQNPQIRNMYIQISSIDLLKRIGEILPHLNNLSVGQLGLSQLDFEVYLKNVEKFQVAIINEHIDKLFMPKLKDLHVYCHEHISRIITTFVRNHSNITRFHMDYQNSAKCTDLIGYLPNLEELSIRTIDGTFTNINTFIGIINGHPHLTKFDIHLCTKADRETLEQLFSSEWEIKEYNQQGISMQKKAKEFAWINIDISMHKI